MSVAWRGHIESDLNVLRGKPRIKGTRIRVSLILGYLASGYTAEQIVGEFPDLKPEPTRRATSSHGSLRMSLSKRSRRGMRSARASTASCRW
jgi:uncharacterized protein (DUF433 family)